MSKNSWDWKNLADLTTASLAPRATQAQPVSAPARKVSPAFSPTTFSRTFSTTRKQYRPALENQNLAQALAQLQQMRTQNRANPAAPRAPRIVSPQFPTVQGDFARIHRPKKK